MERRVLVVIGQTLLLAKLAERRAEVGQDRCGRLRLCSIVAQLVGDGALEGTRFAGTRVLLNLVAVAIYTIIHVNVSYNTTGKLDRRTDVLLGVCQLVLHRP